MTKTQKIDNKSELDKKVEDQQKAIEDYVNTLKRLQADFENYMKRVEREKEEFASYANHKMIAKLLTVADDFDKALGLVKKSNEIGTGIEMIHKQLHKILQEEGVVPINAVGDKLDPYKHEVIDVIEGEEDNVIVEELQKGYMIKNKVLRPSRVKISKLGGEK